MNTLRHLHLPGETPFKRASHIQHHLVRKLLEDKGKPTLYRHVRRLLEDPADDLYKSYAKSLSPPPPPTLLTFSPDPVYTLGRREQGTLELSTIRELRKPLPIPKTSLPYWAPPPDVEETLRGGQITFHGPGQLVIYPILDIKAVKSERWPKGLTVRCYVDVLEQATINVLRMFGIQGIRTANPGVWIDEDTKIAALGLHLRRNITSYGVGLNVTTDLRFFDRIVACGLEGKKMTSIERELWGGKSAEEFRADLQELQPRDRARAEARFISNTNKMDLFKLASAWSREFGALVWGTSVLHKKANAVDVQMSSQFLAGGYKQKERVNQRLGLKKYRDNPDCHHVKLQKDEPKAERPIWVHSNDDGPRSRIMPGEMDPEEEKYVRRQIRRNRNQREEYQRLKQREKWKDNTRMKRKMPPSRMKIEGMKAKKLRLQDLTNRFIERKRLKEEREDRLRR